MSKHTPGPWKYSRWDQWGDARFYISQQEGAPYTPNYSDVATLIAETPSGELVRIQEANARLISAAPDLLDACKAALSDDQPYIEKCRAAIAKATGEQA